MILEVLRVWAVAALLVRQVLRIYVNVREAPATSSLQFIVVLILYKLTLESIQHEIKK